MKRSLYFASLVTIVSLGMSVPAFAQCPANTLTGRWTFAAGNIVGQFVATQSPAGFGGRLSIASTTITGGTNVTRSDNDNGSFAFDPDCQGGLLYLNLAGLPVQWLFTKVTSIPFGFTLTLRASGIPVLQAPPGTPAPPAFPVPQPLVYLTALVGTAWPAPTSCPVANPLNVLSGNVPFTSLTGGVGSGTLLIGPQNLLVPFWLDPQGTFIATVNPPSIVPGPPATDGIRPLLPPPPPLGPPYPRAGDTGTYTVTADCTRALFHIYFQVPRPFIYDGYARRELSGRISFSVIDIAAGFLATFAPPTPASFFGPSTGTINFP